MLLAHVHTDQLEQCNGKMWMFFQMRLQNRKLDRIDLRSTARDRTEDVGRLFLIDRQLADDAPTRRQTQGEYASGLAVFHNENMPRAHNVEIACRCALTKQIRPIVQRYHLPRDRQHLPNERLLIHEPLLRSCL